MYIMMISFTFCMHQNNHTYRQHCHCNTAGVQNMPGVDNIVHYNIPAAFTSSNILAAYNSYCKQHSCCIQQLLQHSCSTQQLLQATFLLHTTVAASNIPAACNSYCKQHSCCTQQLLQHSCCTQQSLTVSWQHYWCTWRHWNSLGVQHCYCNIPGIITAFLHSIVLATVLVYTSLAWQHCWCTHHSNGNIPGVRNIPGVHNTGMATLLVYTALSWQHSRCTQHSHHNIPTWHNTVIVANIPAAQHTALKEIRLTHIHLEN